MHEILYAAPAMDMIDVSVILSKSRKLKDVGGGISRTTRFKTWHHRPEIAGRLLRTDHCTPSTVPAGSTVSLFGICRYVPGTDRFHRTSVLRSVRSTDSFLEGRSTSELRDGLFTALSPTPPNRFFPAANQYSS